MNLQKKKKLNDHSHSQWAFCAEAASMLPLPDPQTNNIVNGMPTQKTGAKMDEKE